MSPFSSILLLVKWLLGLFAQSLQRLSPRAKPAPLLVFLGGLVMALQLQAFGFFHKKAKQPDGRGNPESLLRTLHQVGRLIVRSDDPQSLLDGACQLLVSRRDYSLAWIGSLNSENAVIQPVARAGQTQGYLDGVKITADDSPTGRVPTATALRTGQPSIIQAISRDPNFAPWREGAVKRGFHSAAAFPMRSTGRILGVLTVYAGRVNAFGPEEAGLLQEMADDLAHALVGFETRRLNALQYQAERGQRQLAEALAQAAVALNSSLNLTEVLDHILEQIMRVVPCRSVNLMLVEGEVARVVRLMDRSDKGETRRSVSNSTLKLSTRTLKQMIETGQPVLIPNTLLDQEWISLEQTSWIRSYAAAPLIVDGQVIGFLNMNSDRVNFFTRENTWLLQPFASNAALAIRNARYASALEQRVLERTAELTSAKERIERILVSVPDAVFVLDDQQSLLHSNPAGDALLSQAQEQGLSLFSPEFLASLKIDTPPHEKAILEVNGRSYQALASSLPYQWHETGLVIVFRDVTRFRELDQMKSRFVSDVSHELRTPLTNLSLYIDLLSMSQDPVKSQNYVGTLRRETGRLTDLIEDLLTISRLEAGRVDIEIQPVNVDNLVADLVRDRAPMASKRQLNLEYKPSAGLPIASADPRLLTQVLSNLLTNALNYTPAGGSIWIFTEPEPGGGGAAGWIWIHVRDNGVGISEQDQPHLFERFFRGTASRITGAPGTGLGLAISKEIVERLGGGITVESQTGQGSTFTIWLKSML